MELKTFKIKEVVDAIEKDGLEHLRGNWINVWDGIITGGCVLAQGAYNLGALPANDVDEINDEVFQYDPASDDYYPTQGKEFDTTKNLFDELNKFTNVSKWNEHPSDWRAPSDKQEITECGSAIVYWNDLCKDDNKTFYLKNYEEVVDMVKDILAPYMEKEITLQTVDYSAWKAPVLA